MSDLGECYKFAASKLVAILDWPSARLCVLAYALAGHFADTMMQFKSFDDFMRRDSDELLIAAGSGDTTVFNDGTIVVTAEAATTDLDGNSMVAMTDENGRVGSSLEDPGSDAEAEAAAIYLGNGDHDVMLGDNGDIERIVDGTAWAVDEVVPASVAPLVAACEYVENLLAVFVDPFEPGPRSEPAPPLP